LAAGMAVKAMPLPDGSLLSAIAAVFAVWSFGVGLFNLLPLQIRQLELDGYLALIVSRNPRQLSMRVAAFKMRTHVLEEKPIDAINRRWVALAEASGRISLQNRTGAWLAYVYWTQRRQFERAAMTMERMLRGSGDADVNFKGLLFAECAVFSALR